MSSADTTAFPTASLRGRVAVVTGASRGFGRQIAHAMAAAGAAVVLVSRNGEALRLVLDELAGAGASAAGEPRPKHCFEIADVTDAAAIESLAARVADRFGGADILVNNAGINIRKPLREFPVDDWRRVVETNLFGPMFCCRAFVTKMIERRWGRIVNIASMMARVAMPERSAYCASKAGLVGMTRALALEFAPYGITVNAISPGPFATEMNVPLLQDPVRNAEFARRIPLGRWGDPREIGPLAVFLASDQAAFITGADLLIDGGWSAQ